MRAQAFSLLLPSSFHAWNSARHGVATQSISSMNDCRVESYTLMLSIGVTCRKNIFFCPLSLSAALGMVRLGARSGSARQIDQVRTALRVRAQSRPRSLGKPDCSLRPGVAGNCIFIYGARPAFSSIQPYFQAQGRPWLPEDACCVSPDSCSPVSVCLRACSATSVVSDSLQPH